MHHSSVSSKVLKLSNYPGTLQHLGCRRATLSTMAAIDDLYADVDGPCARQ